MRRRTVSVLVAAAFVAAALVAPGCAAKPRERAAEADLRRSSALLDEHRYDDAMRSYIALAQRTDVGGPDFDAALAGVAGTLTSRIGTMSVPAQVDEIVAFYDTHPPRLYPPALVNYTSALLLSSAEKQLAWAELFHADRTRWLRGIGARGEAPEVTVSLDDETSRDVKLMSTGQADRIASATNRLRQPAATGELFRLVASLADANRIYLQLADQLADGERPTQAHMDVARRANKVVERDLPRARELLDSLR